MGSLFNQYSFLILAILLVIVAGVILLTRKPRWNDYLAFAVILGALIAAWMILRPRQTPLMNDTRAVLQVIGAGTPALLEFQSPYCLACTAIKPAVDGLEQELGGRIHIIRLNVQEPVGRELGAVYRFEFTPTFIFFDSQGRELWRQIGGLDVGRVRSSLK